MQDRLEDIFDKEYNAHTKNVEEVIKSIKENGGTQFETVKILVKKLGLSLSEADYLVLNSKSWSENFDANINLRNGFHSKLSKDD